MILKGLVGKTGSERPKKNNVEKYERSLHSGVDGGRLMMTLILLNISVFLIQTDNLILKIRLSIFYCVFAFASVTVIVSDPYVLYL